LLLSLKPLTYRQRLFFCLDTGSLRWYWIHFSKFTGRKN